VELAHHTLYQREHTAKVCCLHEFYILIKIFISKEFDEMQRRARSPSRTRSKSIEHGRGN
jgi:hypothetical protein